MMVLVKIKMMVLVKKLNILIKNFIILWVLDKAKYKKFDV